MLGRGNSNLHLACLEFFSFYPMIGRRPLPNSSPKIFIVLVNFEVLNVDGCTNLILFTYPLPDSRLQ